MPFGQRVAFSRGFTCEPFKLMLPIDLFNRYVMHTINLESVLDEKMAIFNSIWCYLDGYPDAESLSIPQVRSSSIPSNVMSIQVRQSWSLNVMIIPDFIFPKAKLRTCLWI
jgi:hypothetical protein